VPWPVLVEEALRSFYTLGGGGDGLGRKNLPDLMIREVPEAAGAAEVIGALLHLSVVGRGQPEAGRRVGLLGNGHSATAGGESHVWPSRAARRGGRKSQSVRTYTLRENKAREGA
jgi:hypothetical protein